MLPSNEGRGYVLRRIMRRAMRHAELLGAREPLIWKLVPTLTREMGQVYAELVRAEVLITETLKLEETRFRRTLEKGLTLLDEAVEKLEASNKPTTTVMQAGTVHLKVFPGETAFTLYDTYGFPLDLTQDALRPRGITVDTDAFNDAMEGQREKARSARFSSAKPPRKRFGFRCAKSTVRPSSSATKPRAQRASSPRSSRTERKSQP